MAGTPPSEGEEERARNLAHIREAALARGIGQQHASDDGFHSRGADHEAENEVVYVTEAWREWERHYLVKLSKRIHQMVCAELDRFEEALFMLYVGFDENLDGAVVGQEAENMLQAIQSAHGLGALEDANMLMDKDGCISFLSLLEWYSDRGNKDATIPFTFSSIAISVVGSGKLSNDARLESLSWSELRANVVGYRRCLGEVKKWQEERLLENAREIERENGVLEAMPAYYEALSKEFEGDSEHLFELFNEVDDSGNMQLELQEVRQLLRLLDTSASEADLTRYICEINLSDGPLSFASLLDWWDQARTVPNSLVAEKGATLLASVKARAATNRFSSLFSENHVKKQWRHAEAEDRLQALADNYAWTLSEVREYKMERDLRLAETECAQL